MGSGVFRRAATEALEGAAGLLLPAVEAVALNISAARSRGLSAWDLAGGGVGLWLGAEKASGCQRPGGLSGLVFTLRNGKQVAPLVLYSDQCSDEVREVKVPVRIEV